MVTILYSFIGSLITSSIMAYLMFSDYGKQNLRQLKFVYFLVIILIPTFGCAFINSAPLYLISVPILGILLYIFTYGRFEKFFLKWNTKGHKTPTNNRLSVSFHIPINGMNDIIFRDYEHAQSKAIELGYCKDYFTQWYDKLEILPYPNAVNFLEVGANPEVNYLT